MNSADLPRNRRQRVSNRRPCEPGVNAGPTPAAPAKGVNALGLLAVKSIAVSNFLHGHNAAGEKGD